MVGPRERDKNGNAVYDVVTKVDDSGNPIEITPSNQVKDKAMLFFEDPNKVCPACKLPFLRVWNFRDNELEKHRTPQCGHMGFLYVYPDDHWILIKRVDGTTDEKPPLIDWD